VTATRQFCTLFDINYLPRGLVLYRSLERTGTDFRLHVFCMDEESEQVLRRLSLPRLVVVPLRELERHDPALLSVKPTRTQVEYCWTATPAVCLYVLDAYPDAAEVTYLDADLMFFSSPEALFDEMGDAATMIVPHRYAPEHRWKEPESGTFNVEWLTFRRDSDGLAALQWWHDRCIEWCYFRVEDGKMGDQKYLDEFPSRFGRVHVLEHPGGGLAPWNVTNHKLDGTPEHVLVDGRPLVFFHYHSLRLYAPGLTARLAAALRYVRPGVAPVPLPWTSNYDVPQFERRLVWYPYLRAIGRELELLRVEGRTELPGVQPVPVRELASRTGRAVARRVKRGGLAVGRKVNPVRWAALRFVLYGDSWKSRDVAAQMVELTSRELEHPEQVPPYRSFKELLDVVLQDDSLPGPARFLDIGCGVGAYGELLERWAPGRFEYVGADYSEEIVDAARKRFPQRTFQQRDVFEPGSLSGFDVVFASGLVDVLSKYDEALDALLAADAPWVLLHRQRIADQVHAEVAPGYRGQRTYRSYVTLEHLERAAARYGRRITASVQVDDRIQSFVLVR